ncbi:hypothetical protein [Deinococcus ruber]|uniref:Uncharacterized protein n=1 Tax=Deinococcus ruber TaxID=1848197 RepID=A0A918CLM0_9DEIO|nr:hypothetical protein [Deinococcus ruber]GGR30260.1 hypothetical protein GCM10008957_46320 [Deinococcus ruber]
MGNLGQIQIISIAVEPGEERCSIGMMQGSEHFALNFEEQVKALRFIRYLTAEGACVSQPRMLAKLTQQPALCLSKIEVRPIHTLAPAHAHFIKETQNVLWSPHSLPRKKKLVLSLLRSLLSARSLEVLSHLSPEILIARVKAEFSEEQLPF